MLDVDFKWLQMLADLQKPESLTVNTVVSLQVQVVQPHSIKNNLLKDTLWTYG